MRPLKFVRVCAALSVASGGTLREALALPPGLAPPSALLVESLASPDGVDARPPRFSWSLASTARGSAQAAFELAVCPDASCAAAALFESGRVDGNASSLVELPLPTLPASTRLHWRVRVWDAAGGGPSDWSPIATFSTGLFAPADWEPSEWVSSGPANASANLFRVPFTLPGAITSALLHVAGVGAHAAFVNGARAGGVESKWDGGWTRFSARVLYTTRDVTAQLVEGDNVIGIALGAGWFSDAGWYKRPPYSKPSAANGGGFSYPAPLQTRALFVAHLADGSVLRVATDSAGRCTATRGDVTFDSLYDGEEVDGIRRAALAGWATPSFVPMSNDWLAAVPAVSVATNATLSSQAFEPVLRVSETPALASWEGVGGTSTIYDFGANGVGVVRWTLRGVPAGTRVTFRHAEVAQHPPYGPADGSLYYGSLRNAHQTDVYTASGGDAEVFEPMWTTHGFRYAEVSGLPFPLPLEDVVAIRQHNAVAQGADVAFPALTAGLLNTIKDACVSTIASNLQGGPGSCGARDERQFFTGDTAVTAHTSLQHFRMRALLASWVQTGLDEQNKDGSIGYYLPTPITDARDGSPQWSTGWLTVIAELVQLEGDLATARAALPAILRYIAFNEGAYYAPAIAKCGSLACFNPVWPAEWQENGPSPNASCVNANAYIRDLRLASDIAAALGEDATASNLRARAATRRAEFHSAFFSAGTYGAGTDTEVALALTEGVPPTSAAASALLLSLSDAIFARNCSVNVGIVGGRALFALLAPAGLARVGLCMLQRTDAPSYGYMVSSAGGNEEPSATIWELWRADIGDATMSSRNHLMFASVATLLFDLAAGVSPRGVGYAAGARISPAGWGLLDTALPQAEAFVDTPRGRVTISWENNAGGGGGGGASCGSQEEAEGCLTLECPRSQVVSNVSFASFGTPRGSCATGWALGACNAPTSVAVVTAACIGASTCTIPSSVAAFGGIDPCEGVKKLLAVALVCSGGRTPMWLGSLNVSVPVGIGAATIVIPPFGNATRPLTVTEGGMRVWDEGAFVPGVPGVEAGRVAADGSIELTVSTGAFAFEATAAS